MIITPSVVGTGTPFPKVPKKRSDDDEEDRDRDKIVYCEDASDCR